MVLLKKKHIFHTGDFFTMPMTHTETIGFCSQVTQFLEENAANLQTEGVDVSNWVKDLTTKRTAATRKKWRSERRKTRKQEPVIDD